MAPCLHVFISLFLVDVEVALIRGGVGDATLDEEWQVELVRAAAAGEAVVVEEGAPLCWAFWLSLPLGGVRVTAVREVGAA